MEGNSDALRTNHGEPRGRHREGVHTGPALSGIAVVGPARGRDTRESILKAYPYLETADIDEALRYAAFLAEDETVELAK